MALFRLTAAALVISLSGAVACACTSAIISGSASASGRQMLWKHRDTSSESNFIERVPASVGSHAYIALFNAGDSLLREAWIGVNDADFAIMNTASYNLAPDTAAFKDQEGIIMSLALRHCTTVNDFAAMLDTLPRPLGVQANFGVIDSRGDGAYFETDDYNYKRYDLRDEASGVIIRTNYSFSGNDGYGYGYIRYDNASRLLSSRINARSLVPADFTETASRSFYNSLTGRDAMTDTAKWAVDQDFIPRHSSTASVVIELTGDGNSTMWAALGYPPCAVVEKAHVDSVPEVLRPVLPGYKSPSAEASLEKKRKAFPITRGSGPNYIDMDYIRREAAECHKLSMDHYERE